MKKIKFNTDRSFQVPVNYLFFPEYFEQEGIPTNGATDLDKIRYLEIKKLQTSFFLKNTPFKPISKIVSPFMYEK